MKKSEQRKQCHSSQSTGQVNSIASQGWQLFHVLADETSEDREEDNNQRRIPQRDRKETHHVKKSRAHAEAVFPRHVRERQMQQRGKPGRNKKKRRCGREYRSEPPLRPPQKHTESYAEKTCDKRQIF